jgi:hypothetical protein
MLSTGQKVAKVDRKGFYKNNHITRKTPKEEIDLFRGKLQQHLQWNSARLAFVSIFLIALTRVNTVNLIAIMVVKVMLSVGLLRLCSVVLNPVAFVWSPLIFKIRSASLN